MNDIRPEYAPMIASRTAVGIQANSDFEADAECETCEYEGLMEFFQEDAEIAAASCPECEDRVERYTGPDA